MKLLMYKIVQEILKFLFFLAFDVKVYIKDEYKFYNKKCIICSNHNSNLDPLIIGAYYKRQINFMAKKELYKSKILGALLYKLDVFPVDREGISLTAIKKALRVLKEDKILGIFPEGTRVKDYNSENAKPGIAMIAYKSKSPVFPVYIDANYKFRGRVNIYFGKPKDYFENVDEKANIQLYSKVSKEILNDIYMLKDKNSR